MAHPDDLLLGEAGEEGAAAAVQLCLAELGGAGARDFAAELQREQLGAVADAERRDPELEEGLVDPWSALGVDRGRAAGEDQRGRIPRPHLLDAERVRHEFRVDAGVAHAPGDQLRVLAAEVEDEHRPLLRRRLGRG